MTTEEMDAVWTAIKSQSRGYLNARGINQLTARFLDRIKAGRDWRVTDTMTREHMANHKDWALKGITAAVTSCGYGRPVALSEVRALVTSEVLPLMAHVAKKPRCLMASSERESLSATGSTGLTAYLSDYRHRCWAYVQLLTGGTEFTMLFDSSGLPIFTLDVLVPKKLVNKTDNRVHKEELDKALKQFLNQDSYEMYDTYVLKSKPPEYRADASGYGIRVILDDMYSAAEAARLGQNFIDSAQSTITFMQAELDKYTKFNDSVKDRYPATYTERMTALFDALIDGAPKYISLGRDWRTGHISALAKVLLKGGFTSEEMVTRLNKLKEMKEMKEAARA